MKRQNASPPRVRALLGAIGVLGLLAVVRAFGRSWSRGAKSNATLWILHQYAVSPDLPESTRQYELAILLREQGWHTTIFATGFNHKARRYVRPVSPLRPVFSRNEMDVDFVWLYSTPYQNNGILRYLNMISYFFVSLAVGLTRQRPGVVIGTSPNMLAALSAWLIARRHRVPFILEVQDLWPESIIQLGFHNRWAIIILEWLERFLYQQADHIIALTEGVRDGMVQKHVDPARIKLISNAAMRPAPIDETRRVARRRELGWANRVVAIWIGAHGAANGLEVLVEAAKRLRGGSAILFVLVGDGPEKPRLIQESTGLDNIVFLDAVPKEEVMDLLRAADVGVIVHRDTGAVRGARPNKLFDYMAAHLPIVLNLDGEARGLVEHANCGIWVRAESPEAIAVAIEQLAVNPEARQQLGENGFQCVSHEHSREATALQLCELLQGVTTSSRPLG